MRDRGTSTFHNLFCRRGPSVQAVTASGWAFADASWYIHYTQSLLELLVYGGYKTPLPELVDCHSPQFPQLSDLAVGLFYSCSLQFLFQVFQPTKTPMLVRFPPRGGGVLSGWGGAAGTLEPLTYTRASSAEFCYPILE